MNMIEEKNPVFDKKDLLEALAPHGVKEALGKLKKIVRPRAGVDLVQLTETLVKRRSAKKN